MKVSVLIDKLKQMPPDAEVDMEGCDCIGRAEAVQLDGDSVLITRTMDEADRARNRLLYPSIDNEPIEEVEVEDAIH